MQRLKSYTLWATFERLDSEGVTEAELALSAKAIIDRSNVVLIYHGVLCAMIYQQISFSDPVASTSKVIVIMSLLIATCNRLQYEGDFANELRVQIQQTGPLLPTIRYILPELLLVVLLVFEGFKAGGVAGATATVVVFVMMFSTGWYFPMKQRPSNRVEGGVGGAELDSRNV
ncbi:hypothetical protein DL96DRAFT_1609638 [Flagelloscypha sp. PMI_526]|nr:hypothetical protein DL96DRAFT_1609638 [Flagelloscypha sp. PMI_526]